jgi:hypothetical protein
MAGSPYDQSRQQVPPPPRFLPSFAILCNVPTAVEYANNPPITTLGIAIAFHRIFSSYGVPNRDLVNIYPSLSMTSFNREVYVNLDLDRIVGHVVPVGPPSLNYSFNEDRFAKAIVDRYRAYATPTEFEFCIPDNSLNLSRRMANCLASEDSYVVQSESDPARTQVVNTLTEAWWRRDAAGNFLSAVLLPVIPVPIRYQTNEFLYDSKLLEPPLNPGETVRDYEKYYKTTRDLLWKQLRRLNSIVNIISNFGDHSPLHPDYVARLARIKIEIGGHTDKKASAAVNEPLSLKRAQHIVNHVKISVAGILTYPAAVGPVPDIISSRLTAKGYGYTECPGASGVPDPSCRNVTTRLVMDS